MSFARLALRGRITVPKDIRVALGVQPGDQLVFTVQRDGSITIVANTIDVRSLRGTLKSYVRGISAKRMRDAIRQSAARNT